MKFRTKVCTIITICFVCTATSLIGLSIQNAAEPFIWPENAPRPDDVTMRTLWFRPVDENDKQNTFAALDAFHATRLEWTYLRAYEHKRRFMVEEGQEPENRQETLWREKALIRKVKASGRFFGGAANASTGTDVIWHGYQDATKKHTILDIHGEPLVAAHMKHWAAPQSPGCANNPHYLQGYVQYIQNYIDAGADGIQRDEPSGNYAYAQAGVGCYCSYCIEGFREYLKRINPSELADWGIENAENFNFRDYVLELGVLQQEVTDFDWSDPQSVNNLLSEDPVASQFVDYQAESQARFFKIVRMRLDAMTERTFTISSNNTSFQRFEPELYHDFDFYMSELMMRSGNPAHIYDRSREARSRGKVQVFGSPKTLGKEYTSDFLKNLKRKVIATSYAVGGLSRVPWDIFQQTRDGKGRYYGDAADYADLYAMVRASGRYLADYCDAGAVGPDINSLNRYGDQTPLEISGGSNAQIYAFIRAIPRDEEAPVVIHLVDWSDTAEPFSLKLNHSQFNESGKLRIKLRIPGPYDKRAHVQSELRAQAMRKPDEPLGMAQAAAYQGLVKEIRIDAKSHGAITTVEIPKVSPWGMLIIEPVQD